MSGTNAQLTLLAPTNFNGTASLALTIRDLVGDTTLAPLTITVRPTNDPPAVALTALATPIMDPAVGTPVALASQLVITPGVDADVTRSANGLYLGFIATVDGSDGVDLLSLCGDGGYRIDATTIAALPAGTAIATWSRDTGDTRRLAITLNSAGTQAQLQDLVRLLRYSHAQNPVSQLTRTLSITVVEPDTDGGTDSAAPVTCTCRVAPINRPPEVTLQAVEVEPMGSAPLRMTLADSDGLANLTVTVVAPFPTGGRLEPSSCRGDVAIAGGMRYVHTASDLSDDSVTLSVSDGRSTAVSASAAVAIRSRPDRESIISDPLLEAVRGQTLSWPVRTAPTATSLRLVAYGAPFPSLPVGVSIQGSSLAFDWATIPAATSWLAFAIEATTTDTSIAAGQRVALQRMLVRIREIGAGGVSN